MSPNPTSIAYRILSAGGNRVPGVGSISESAANKIAARLSGKRPPTSQITVAIQQAHAAGEIRVLKVGEFLVLQ